MNLLAIIPTRSKSEGLPGKSVRPLAGKPLVQHTIEQAKRVGLFKTVVVVSDGEAEAAIAKEQGVFFIRKPEALAGGEIVIERIIELVLDVLGKNGYSGYDAYCLLNPTSPLRSDDDVRACVKKFSEGSALSLVSVCKRYPIFVRRVRSGKRGYWHVPGLKTQNRQQRKPHYVQNGAVYLSKIEHFREAKKLLSNRCYVYVMPPERSLDIDTIWDFVAVEAVLKEQGKVDGGTTEFVPAGTLQAPPGNPVA